MQGSAITRFRSPPPAGALALALALALVGAGALAAAAAPRGRVIRVERESASPLPRICMIGNARDPHLCFGKPRAGERVTLLSQSEPRALGELVIESVSEPTDLGQAHVCVSGGAQVVTGSYTSDTDRSGRVMGLRGARLDAEVARVLNDVPAPSGRDHEQVKLAVDSDGSGGADLVVTEYYCTPEGAPASGRVTDSSCVDTYMPRHGKLRRVHQDIIRTCR